MENGNGVSFFSINSPSFNLNKCTYMSLGNVSGLDERSLLLQAELLFDKPETNFHT